MPTPWRIDVVIVRELDLGAFQNVKPKAFNFCITEGENLGTSQYCMWCEGPDVLEQGYSLAIRSYVLGAIGPSKRQ